MEKEDHDILNKKDPNDDRSEHLSDDDFENRLYEKGPVPTGGVEYEIKLITLFALEGIRHYSNCNWRISTQNLNADKFDDLVCQYDGGDILLQSKIKQTREVNKGEFLSDNPKNTDFNLVSYIHSFKCIKKFTNIQYLLLCIDAKISSPLLKESTEDDKMLRRIFNIRSPSREVGDVSEDTACKIYQLKSDSKIKKTISRFQENITGKDKKDKWKYTVIEEDDITDFIKKFRCIRICEANVGKIIQERIKNTKKDYVYVLDQVRKWYRMKPSKCVPLTNLYTRSILYGRKSRAKTEKYLNTTLSFEESHKIKENKILLIQPGEKLHFSLIKIVHSLQKMDGKMPDELFHDQFLFIEKDINKHMDYFKLNKFKYLVISLPNSTAGEVREICEKLESILSLKKVKMVFIITDSKDYNNEEYIETTVDTISLNSFEKKSQEMLLKKTIYFQGKTMKLDDLLSKSVDCEQYIDEHVISKLDDPNDSLKIGNQLKCLQGFYITRTLRNDTGSIISDEEDLVNLDKPLIVLLGAPGTGKSTYLIELANRRKEISPYTWIIHFDVNKIITYLEKNCKQQWKISDLMDVLYKEEGVESNFEKELMNSLEKYVLIDGIGETNTRYIEQLRTIMNFCSQLTHATILIAARDKSVLKAIDSSNYEEFTIDELSSDDQIHFFEKYLNYNTNVTELYKTFRKDFRSFRKFMSNPLYLGLLLDMFSETNKVKNTLNISKKVNKYEIYKYFFNSKKKKFVQEHAVENTELEDILRDTFNRYLNDLRFTAIRSIFDPIDLILNVKNPHNRVLQIGILAENHNEYYFRHTSFEEYFAAEYIWNLLLSKNDKILSNVLDVLFSNAQHIGVCSFFENILQHTKMRNSNDISEIAEIYNSILVAPGREGTVSLHHLARKGYVNIIKLLLDKCDSCSGIIDAKDSKDRTAFLLSAKYPRLTKFFVKKGANINAVDRNGSGIIQYTIHYYLTSIREEYSITADDINGAILRLLRNQSFIVNTTEAGETLLHWTSIDDGLFEVVKYLVEDVNLDISSDQYGNTPLHYAAYFDAVDIITYFVKRDRNVVKKVNNNGDTLVHSAAAGNAMNALRYLIETCQMSGSVENRCGNSPLVHAYLNYADDAIDYLER